MPKQSILNFSVLHLLGPLLLISVIYLKADLRKFRGLHWFYRLKLKSVLWDLVPGTVRAFAFSLILILIFIGPIIFSSFFGYNFIFKPIFQTYFMPLLLWLFWKRKNCKGCFSIRPINSQSIVESQRPFYIISYNPLVLVGIIL